MSYILGYKPDQFDYFIEILKKEDVAGVIFFKRNISSLEQLKAQAQVVKALRPNAKLCIDFEGGRVNRFHHLKYYCESAHLLGSLFDNALSHRARQSVLYRYRCQLEPIAKLFSEIEINTVFGPCIDLLGRSPVISSFARSYSKNNETVEYLASTFIEVFSRYNINCVIKHYPSHAMAYGDTHRQCCIDTRSASDLDLDIELYRTLLRKHSGLGVMLSHCIYNNICHFPVSISHYWHNAVKELSPDSIFTDCLDMDGVSGYLTESLLDKLRCYKIFSRLDGHFAKIAANSELECRYEHHRI